MSAPTSGGTAYDCFLTHDWGEDEAGRDNHARVARVCAALKAEGLRPWFDEEQMRGDINDKMVEGIEASASMVCFITKRYLQKAGGKGPNGSDDNCKFEFDYACRRKGVDRMIPVVMEEGCRNASEWAGTVGGKLGGLLYFDLTSDGVAFDETVKRLADEIRVVSGGVCGGGGGGGVAGHAASGGAIAVGGGGVRYREAWGTEAPWGYLKWPHRGPRATRTSSHSPLCL